jgi:hypothetical protein
LVGLGARELRAAKSGVAGVGLQQQLLLGYEVTHVLPLEEVEKARRASATVFFRARLSCSAAKRPRWCWCDSSLRASLRVNVIEATRGGSDARADGDAAISDVGAGRVRGKRQTKAEEPGHLAAVRWARGLDEERVWAIEDCRTGKRRAGARVDRHRAGMARTAVTSLLARSPRRPKQMRREEHHARR